MNYQAGEHAMLAQTFPFFPPWIHMCTCFRINSFTLIGFYCVWCRLQWKGTVLSFQRCQVCTYFFEVIGNCDQHILKNHTLVGNLILSSRKAISFKNHIETFCHIWPLLQWIPSCFWKQNKVCWKKHCLFNVLDINHPKKKDLRERNAYDLNPG